MDWSYGEALSISNLGATDKAAVAAAGCAMFSTTEKFWGGASGTMTDGACFTSEQAENNQAKICFAKTTS